MEITSTQLKCIERISRAVGKVSSSQFESYLTKFIEDYRIIYPKIEFIFLSSFPKSTCNTFSTGAVVVLILVELIDNAIDAINKAGRIEVDLAFLETKGMFNIVVCDSGRGIPADKIEKLFEEGYSTKGQGRGIGLTLVREATRLLRGQIAYEFNGGSVFSASIFPQ